MENYTVHSPFSEKTYTVEAADPHKAVQRWLYDQQFITSKIVKDPQSGAPYVKAHNYRGDAFSDLLEVRVTRKQGKFQVGTTIVVD